MFKIDFCCQISVLSTVHSELQRRWIDGGCVTISELLLLFTPLEFFTSVLADGFSLEFEWQHVSSSLLDSSQDSGRS